MVKGAQLCKYTEKRHQVLFMVCQLHFSKVAKEEHSLRGQGRKGVGVGEPHPTGPGIWWERVMDTGEFITLFFLCVNMFEVLHNTYLLNA